MRVVTLPRLFASSKNSENQSRKVRPALGGLFAVALLAGCSVDVRDQPAVTPASRKAPPLILKPYNPPPIRTSVQTPVGNTPVGNAPISTVASKKAPPTGRGPISTAQRAEADEREDEDDPVKVSLYD
ncbi:hypothetical protein [Salipiger sp. PrR003]|uniref:hypothetical protein n=1 Tax=Salipiger sp. PrR003 TaxID=2706776 RepID=UPI0013D92204|nr:hypothetical protein [Salipiger sp. PrR003]NDV50787.1 hypothetical protein [Salipiger sp. PrR003]